MSEFSLPKKTHFSSLLLSDFFLFCSFILSHPLYFFYFIFFFPYLFKLLSFLSPLFFTTFLLLSVFLTFSPNLLHDALTADFAESKLSLLLETYQAVAEKLRSKNDENGKEKIDHFEELEVYKIVFDTSEFDLEQNLYQYPEVEIKEEISTNAAEEIKTSIQESYVLSIPSVPENSVVIPIRCKDSQLIAEGKKLGVVLHQKEEFGKEIGSQKGEKEVKAISENLNKKLEEQYPKRGSKEMGLGLGYNKLIDNNGEYLPRASSERIWNSGNGEFSSPKAAMEKSPSMRSNGSFGSMRKEKEWRRTLACKLFEERHNAEADGSEGMDMLWETYETDSMKLQSKSKSKRGKKECYKDEEEEEVEEEEDDEEEENEGQLCCLQALKFSAGKMNLGMGKPNLLKISKAFKGIGWLHHVSKKKSYH